MMWRTDYGHRAFLVGIGIFALSILTTNAQFPPEREGVKTVPSRFHDGISISYKEPGLCETTPSVRSFSGYVHLPAGTLDERGESQEYPINTFFWFFEARHDPANAPLAIWLNGGPGGSSMVATLAENGPCFVGDDSNSTILNPWSWNNEVNMLYIDQPNQVGFSYGSRQNVTVDLFLGDYEDDEDTRPSWRRANFTSDDDVPEQNNTFLVGTYPSMDGHRTANSTNHSAIALWHFAQTWFAEFPAYAPHDRRISLWSESYGGHYGPAIASYFQHQNEKITNGDLRGPGLMYLHLDTVGIVNGCIDSLLQDRAYADFAHNNTYGVEAFNQSQYDQAIDWIEKSGGINDLTTECRRLAQEYDPHNIGHDERVNSVCRNASMMVGQHLTLAYLRDGRYGWFDVTHPAADPFPAEFFIAYLNQHWVQRALGVPVNFTFASDVVSMQFMQEGDMPRAGQLDALAYLLDRGIKVALVYGDRDFACNWIGGERVSTSIPYAQKSQFQQAGYAPMAVTPFHSGGQVRQLGNLSFTRIYQAGHMVPAYQPQAAYLHFMRAMFNRDIATGQIPLHDDLTTHGPSHTWMHRNDVLPAPEPRCYTRSRGLALCSKEQKEWLRDGTAIVKDWIVVGREAGRKQDGYENGHDVDESNDLSVMDEEQSLLSNEL